MQTWEIYIGGLVQGVGFRPFVVKVATEMHLDGNVRNTNDGLHIRVNASAEDATRFYNYLLQFHPVNAIITVHSLRESPEEVFSGFSITVSDDHARPDLLLTPDISICPDCRYEMSDPGNRRYRYPFITCLNCGPRYSILTGLPYDRNNTTMDALPMCEHCIGEYNDVHSRRHFSQTNSCNECSIPIHLYGKEEKLSDDKDEILLKVNLALQEGAIVAVKGMGGYLLICDATAEAVTGTLRRRKRRPAKPFAVLYASTDQANNDVYISRREKEEMESKASPIVLCRLKPEHVVHASSIAPGLNRIGVMLPSTGLLSLIAEQFGKPLIATSGNISGSPVIYKDEEALEILGEVADMVLTYDRDITVPQDDSVVLYTAEHQQRIVLRRSRGLAPNYYPNPVMERGCLLAMGAEIKSAFSVLNRDHIYTSQYLGDQTVYESQLSYRRTLGHMINLLQARPEKIIIDAHPGYSVSHYGIALSESYGLPVTTVQHHKAHFAAVLAENDLLYVDEPVLGISWDGTGYGDDGHIWGGEFFLYSDGSVERVAHLEYYPQLLGDRMSREPALSAVALCSSNPLLVATALSRFDITEREYLTRLLKQPAGLLTSSMGRLLDGIASLLNVQQLNTYEGEAAMKLEALAGRSEDTGFDCYPVPLIRNRADWRPMIFELVRDRDAGVPLERIARKVFVSLADLVRQVARYYNVGRVAFSGGVFQNGLLVDIINSLMQNQYRLYFHRQLSCNDECIGFGQLAMVNMENTAGSDADLINLKNKNNVFSDTRENNINRGTERYRVSKRTGIIQRHYQGSQSFPGAGCC
ncbi:MAG TPA: carbamoyltransferase HypF [Chitinophagaceae bacterium]